MTLNTLHSYFNYSSPGKTLNASPISNQLNPKKKWTKKATIIYSSTELCILNSVHDLEKISVLDMGVDDLRKAAEVPPSMDSPTRDRGLMKSSNHSS